MSIPGWLVSRLTPSKQTSEGWVQFAQAMETYWGAHFQPKLNALLNMKSVFYADEETLDERLAELDIHFEDSLSVSVESKAFTLSARRDDIHRKETELPLVALIKRDFGGLDAQWQPLYARITDVYGSEFLTADEVRRLGHSLDEYFMTSRGKIVVATESVKDSGATQQEFRAALLRQLDRLVPTHITYDGVEFKTVSILGFELPVVCGSGSHTGAPNISFISEVHKDIIQSYNTVITESELQTREYSSDEGVILFDVTPADFCPLDSTFE